jgi:hypothetical protein
MLNELAKECFENSKDHGFYDGTSITHSDGEPVNIPEKICLMHSELSEALEEYRQDPFVLKRYYNGDKPEGFGIELADCIIRILDTCGAFGIDIDACVNAKMMYNRTRPYKHGKVC